MQYDFLESEYNLNLKELSKLRETIYTIQNSAEQEDEIQKTEPEFPYYSKKRIVIAGRHKQWLHSIQQYIPNAVLIHPSSHNFDITLIKNADVVWFETNTMPHSLFYKISDIAKNNGTQMEYFVFQSAKKCAVQIFLPESKNTSS